MLGAMFAAMSMQWTVARAVGFGVFKDHLPFVRTAKGGATRKRADFPAFWEAVLAALLVLGAISWSRTNYEQVREINIFAVVLVVQSLPFLAAVGARRCSRAPRFNEFAYLARARGQALPSRCRGPRDRRRRRSRTNGCTGAEQSCVAKRRSSRSRPSRPRSAVSTSRTQYDVPTGIASSLKL